MKINKTIALGLLFVTIAGCSQLEPKIKQQNQAVREDLRKLQVKTPEIVNSTPGAWLAGAAIEIAEPTLPILSQNVIYHSTKAVSLSDVSAWIQKTTGLSVDIAELKGVASANGVSTSTTTLQMTTPILPAMNNGVNQNGANAYPLQQNMNYMFIDHDGSVASLLDILASKSTSWWKVMDGRIVFYRQETKTFYLPVISKTSTADNNVTTTVGSSGSGTTTGVTQSGGLSQDGKYVLDIWTDITATATAIAPGASVAINKVAGSLTVTGTPAQLHHIESWVKVLSAQLSQQVAIHVSIYSVNLNTEDNYTWDPTVVFKSAAGIWNYSLTGAQGPVASSTLTPAGLAIGVLSNATSGVNTQYSGSKLAFNALSTLGNVSEKFNQTVVSMNGQSVPIQVANSQGYIASASVTTTANVGTTSSITSGTLITGFTAMFMPRIVNGKIILSMTLTNSTSNGLTTVTSGGSTIQTPNVDSYTFEQSVSLTPGDALLLTGLQDDKGSANKSGVGNASLPIFGGGIDNSIQKRLIGIVITANVL